MRIALASPRVAANLEEGLAKVEHMLAQAAASGAAIVCFPEAYLPGLRGQDFTVWPFHQDEHDLILEKAAVWTKQYAVAAILGMERLTAGGRQIAAYVLDAAGQSLGYQTKNQLDPSEDAFYIPGSGRRLFKVSGVPFGIALCHEGWRYPETVRWAAARGAKVVFHPQHTGNERAGTSLTCWGAADNPYYEQAMRMRARENTIYFASVNYALRYQESTTSLIDPAGACQDHLPYGQEGLLIATLDLDQATGVLAQRYAPARYHDLTAD